MAGLILSFLKSFNLFVDLMIFDLIEAYLGFVVLAVFLAVYLTRGSVCVGFIPSSLLHFVLIGVLLVSCFSTNNSWKTSFVVSKKNYRGGGGKPGHFSPKLFLKACIKNWFILGGSPLGQAMFLFNYSSSGLVFRRFENEEKLRAYMKETLDYKPWQALLQQLNTGEVDCDYGYLLRSIVLDIGNFSQIGVLMKSSAPATLGGCFFLFSFDKSVEMGMVSSYPELVFDHPPKGLDATFFSQLVKKSGLDLNRGEVVSFYMQLVKVGERTKLFSLPGSNKWGWGVKEEDKLRFSSNWPSLKGFKLNSVSRDRFTLSEWGYPSSGYLFDLSWKGKIKITVFESKEDMESFVSCLGDSYRLLENWDKNYVRPGYWYLMSAMKLSSGLGAVIFQKSSAHPGRLFYLAVFDQDSGEVLSFISFNSSAEMKMLESFRDKMISLGLDVDLTPDEWYWLHYGYYFDSMSKASWVFDEE